MVFANERLALMAALRHPRDFLSKGMALRYRAAVLRMGRLVQAQKALFERSLALGDLASQAQERVSGSRG